ncbi:Transketolase central region [uncultured delta proteobacterium]|uniref:Transketolase central region n=1 Tax=uncultured delta proteobacterium TaxID=34034 RepID=A0A212JXX4_9DELT|nr:Transketolase central region [uncultured delta proteobacterium]
MSRSLFLNRAIAEAVRLEMERDDTIILLGEDIINKGGGLSIFLGVPEAFPGRCLDMPICESGFSHFANGAALAGLRPIVDLMFSDFGFVAGDAIVSNAAKFRFNSLGRLSVPVTFVMANGGRGTYGSVGSGSTHSQCSESWFSNVPGLKIVAPYYADDALGLMRSAIRDNDAVLFLYHEGSLGVKCPVPDVQEPIPLARAARVRREGKDITVVAIQSMVPIVEKAAETLAAEGISVEIIDPRVLIPFDEEALLRSIAKTGRLLIVHEAPVRGGCGGEIAAIAAEKGFDSLKKPIRRIGSLNSPIPSGVAEHLMVPKMEDVINGVKSLL